MELGETRRVNLGEGRLKTVVVIHLYFYIYFHSSAPRRVQVSELMPERGGKAIKHWFTVGGWQSVLGLIWGILLGYILGH